MKYLLLVTALNVTTAYAAQYAPAPTPLTTSLLSQENFEQEQQLPTSQTCTLKAARLGCYMFGMISFMNGAEQLMNSFNEPTVTHQNNILVAFSYAALIMPIAVSGAGCWLIKHAKNYERTGHLFPNISHTELNYRRGISHAAQDIGKLLVAHSFRNATRFLSFIAPGSSAALDTIGSIVAMGTPLYVWVKSCDYIATDSCTPCDQSENVNV